LRISQQNNDHVFSEKLSILAAASIKVFWQSPEDTGYKNLKSMEKINMVIWILVRDKI